MKYLFYNDYSEGAHPNILEFLQKTNFDQEMGYGEDSYCLQAKDLIQTALGDPKVDIHFMSGGTQANLTALSSIMKPYESVISAESGHINIHEAGAIEATGHKINAVKSDDGKLTVELIDMVVKSHPDEHTVKPKVVFISNATELGTIYKKSEVQAISDYCRKNGLYLYLDGARLGSGLASHESDLTLNDLCKLTDMFYIGGTKNGALAGEALIIVHNDLKNDFRYHLKHRGALLAKGRLLGIQFLCLFTNNLYFELAKHANSMAEQLSNQIEKLGFKFLTRSSTNQIFPILPNTIIAKLKEMYGFYVWAKIEEEHSAIRLVTSWATKQEKVKLFLEDLESII